MPISLFTSAFVAALVGFGSTVALVLAAAAAVGATPAQSASWLFAVCLIKAIGSGVLSWRHRMPVILAWSTPGAALIAASSGITMPEAVGAFILAGGLIVLTGTIRPLGRIVAMIPDGIAAAMLAGVLLPFCLKAIGVIPAAPFLVLPMIAVFIAVRLWNPSMAVLAALGIGIALAMAGSSNWPPLQLALPSPTLILPEWAPQALIGLGVPLYLVTMASQNLPGFAVLRSNGYEPPVSSALIVSGGLSSIGAFWGAHTVNMAAITAAICMGDDVHPDKSQRWKVGIVYSGAWVGLAFLSPLILTLINALPPEVMTGLVGLALFAPLTGALTGAYSAAPQRFSATVTLAVTASGIAIFGIGAAFWGLVAGLVVLTSEQIAAKVKAAKGQNEKSQR